MPILIDCCWAGAGETAASSNAPATAPRNEPRDDDSRLFLVLDRVAQGSDALNLDLADVAVASSRPAACGHARRPTACR